MDLPRGKPWARNCCWSGNRELRRSGDRLSRRTGDGPGEEPSQRPCYRMSQRAAGSRSFQPHEGKAKLEIRRLVSLATLRGVLLDYLQLTQAHHPLAPSRRGGRGVDELIPLLREEGR
jgi:hypothetical protein